MFCFSNRIRLPLYACRLNSFWLLWWLKLLFPRQVRYRCTLVHTLLCSNEYVLCQCIALDKATRDLPPATKRSLQPSIDKMMASHGGSSHPSQVSATHVQPSANLKGKVVTKQTMAMSSQSLADENAYHNSDDSVTEEQSVQTQPVVAKRLPSQL